MSYDTTLRTVPIYRGIGPEIKILMDEVLTDESWICGGYAWYCCNPKFPKHLPNDIDIFVSDNDHFNMVVENLNLLFNSLPKHNNIEIFNSENAITFTNHPILGLPKIQIIKPHNHSSGTLYNILSHFDMNLISVGIDVNMQAFIPNYLDHDAWQNNKLCINYIRNPYLHFLRLNKYINQYKYGCDIVNIIDTTSEYVHQLSNEDRCRYKEEYDVYLSNHNIGTIVGIES